MTVLRRVLQSVGRLPAAEQLAVVFREGYCRPLASVLRGAKANSRLFTRGSGVSCVRLPPNARSSLLVFTSGEHVILLCCRFRHWDFVERLLSLQPQLALVSNNQVWYQRACMNELALTST